MYQIYYKNYPTTSWKPQPSGSGRTYVASHKRCVVYPPNRVTPITWKQWEIMFCMNIPRTHTCLSPHTITARAYVHACTYMHTNIQVRTYMHTHIQLTNTHHLAAFGWRPVVNGFDSFADPEHSAAELEARDKSAARCRAVKSLTTIRQMGKLVTHSLPRSQASMCLWRREMRKDEDKNAVWAWSSRKNIGKVETDAVHLNQ